MSGDTFCCSFVSIQYIICECGETFPSEEDLKKHLEHDNCREEINEYKCGVCGEIYSTEQACLDHYDENHQVIFEDDHNYTIKSEPCEPDDEDEVEDSKQGLIEFQELVQVPQDTQVLQEEFEEELKYEPKYTPLDAPDEYAEVPLSPSVVNILDAVKAKKRSRQTKNHNIRDKVCEVCGKNYASHAALRYHQRVHTGERPYKCHLCPKTFTMPLFLQVHVRTHTGERPYQCPLCPKAFGNKAALLRHDRVHTGIKPYKCPRCGKCFTQSNSMKLHVNTVHLKQPAPYKSKSRKMKERERVKLELSNVVQYQDISDRSTEEREADRERETEELSNVVQYQEASEDFIIQDEGVEVQYETVPVKVEPQVPEEGEEEIVYEDIDPKEIAYEVIYETV